MCSTRCHLIGERWFEVLLIRIWVSQFGPLIDCLDWWGGGFDCSHLVRTYCRQIRANVCVESIAMAKV